MHKLLDYFVKYDRQDHVSVGIVITGIPGVPDSTALLDGSDAALQTAAEAAGRSTWDETTICAVYGLERKPEPVVAEGPVA